MSDATVLPPDAASRRALKTGADPRRVLKNHKERGHKKFYFTYGDIAQLTQLPEASVRVAAHRKVFDPNSFASVVQFIIGKGSPAIFAPQEDQ